MPPDSNPTSAAGQLLGYSLQVSEFVRQLLLAAPGTVVSLEVFEDVGTTDPDGTITSIQTKSVLDGNPISDRARDLWKTFSNWAAAVRTKRIDPGHTRFRIHVFTKKSGAIAEAFANAVTPGAAAAALEQAKNQLEVGQKELPKTIRHFVESFFATDQSLLLPIIQNFELTFGSGNTEADLRDALLWKWAPENTLQDVLEKALGYVKQRLDTAIQQGHVASISVDEFQREMSAYIGKLRMQNLLSDFAGQPDVADVHTHRLKTYVRQLDIVGADEEQTLHAINAFLRSAHNRTLWAAKGMVWPGSFDEFENALITYWKNTKKQQDLDHSVEDGKKRGFRLLLGCLGHRALLEGKTTPDDFTAGSFHSLADCMEVGWHPEFKQVLSDE